MEKPKNAPPVLAAAAALLAGGMGGMMIGGARLERPLPEIEPDRTRYYPPKVEAKLVYHRHGHKRNREDRAERRALHAEEQSRINKMSNWQRNQWARAGYPKNRIDEFASKFRLLGKRMRVEVEDGRRVAVPDDA